MLTSSDSSCDSVEDTPPNYSQLHRIHKHHRQKQGKLPACLGGGALGHAPINPEHFY